MWSPRPSRLTKTSLQPFSPYEVVSLCVKLLSGHTFSMILKASIDENVCLLPPGMGKEVHAQVVKYDVQTDVVLCNTLVYSYVKNKVNYARRVFDMMLEKNVICSTSMITGYMKQGSVGDAEDVFRKTVEKDVVVFNAMIEGYSKSINTAKRALEVYIDMQRLDFSPMLSSFASITGACSILLAFEIGQQIQELMKTEFFGDVKMGSALIDMYSKCGRTEEARRVFDHMTERNVFSWTLMIDGYGKNGNPTAILELFRRMQGYRNIKVNYVTFLSVLSACTHVGLIARGREIFESMERDYSIKPRMEHYPCMVDLLGQSGLEFILKMPKKPNFDVWAALLSSCRLHGNLEIANIDVNELFKLSSDSRPGAYVALSNALAEAGRWDNISEIREVMKVRGICKDTGFG